MYLMNLEIKQEEKRTQNFLNKQEKSSTVLWFAVLIESSILVVLVKGFVELFTVLDLLNAYVKFFMSFSLIIMSQIRLLNT